MTKPMAKTSPDCMLCFDLSDQKSQFPTPLLCSLAISIIFLLSDVHGAFETQLALVFAIRVSKLACWPPPPYHHPSPLLSCDSAQLILDSTIPIVLWRRNANCYDESDNAANPNQWKWLNCSFDTLEKVCPVPPITFQFSPLSVLWPQSHKEV